MIDLEDIDHIYLYPGSTDLRKGRQALSFLRWPQKFIMIMVFMNYSYSVTEKMN